MAPFLKLTLFCSEEPLPVYVHAAAIGAVGRDSNGTFVLGWEGGVISRVRESPEEVLQMRTQMMPVIEGER